MSNDLQFDLFGGRLLRDAGLRSIARNNPEWFRGAILEIHKLPHGWRGLPEQIRPAIEQAVGAPNHPNAYGMLINRAVKRGLLRRTGRRRPMELDTSHGRWTDEYLRP
ncbi:MAG TPA: hypothetical protein VF753_02385 [Terriglobales bacterium]